MTSLLRTSVTVLALIALASSSYAQQRRTVAVVPFGTDEDWAWLSSATSDLLATKLDRTGALRSFERATIDSLANAIGLDAKSAVDLPLPAAHRLGRWLNADVMILGRVGRSGDREQARAFLNTADISPNRPEGAEMWIAVRMFGYPGQQLLGAAFVEGTRGGLFELYDGLAAHILERLGVDDARAANALGRPTQSLEAFQRVSETVDALRGHSRMDQNRMASNIQRALRDDPSYADAYLLEGWLLESAGQAEQASASYGQTASLDPFDARPRHALARIARKRGDLLGETVALESVLEAAPLDDRAHFRLGQIYDAEGQVQSAQFHYERAAALHGRDPDRLHEVGQFLLGTGRAEAAESYFLRAMTIRPGEPLHHAGLIRSRTRFGAYDDAEQTYGDALKIGVVSADVYVAGGELAVERKDLEAAANRFDQSLELAPTRTDVLLLAGRLYSEQGDDEAAVRVYERALELGIGLDQVAPPLAHAYVRLGDHRAATRVLDTVTWTTDLAGLRAELLEMDGHHRQAAAAYEFALEQKPHDLDLLRKLGLLYAKLGNGSRAVEILNRSLVMAPSDVQTLIALGDLLRVAGRHAKARELYTKAITLGAERVDAYNGLGLTNKALNQKRAAREAFRMTLRLDPRDAVALAGLNRLRPPPPPPPKTASAWASEARASLETGDYPDAIDRFLRALTIDENDASGWNDLGLAYAAVDEIDAARTAFDNAERIDPSPESAYNLGRLHVQINDLASAMASYGQALEREPAFSPASLNLSSLHLQYGNTRAAVRVLKKAIEASPGETALHLLLGNVHIYEDNLEEAESEYLIARKDPNQAASAIVGIGNIALALGDTAGAIDRYHEAMGLDDTVVDAYINLGSVLAAQGRSEEAIGVYESALQKNPRELTTYLNIAVLYYASEQYSEALDHLQVLLEQNPRVVEGQRLVGHIALTTGDFDLAVEAYRIALSLAPHDLDSLSGIANAFEGTGQMDEARLHWEQWIDAATGSADLEPEIDRILRHLETFPNS